MNRTLDVRRQDVAVGRRGGSNGKKGLPRKGRYLARKRNVDARREMFLGDRSSNHEIHRRKAKDELGVEARWIKGV